MHRVADLPGLDIPADTGAERANAFVPAYFGDYERRFELPVERPVRVRRVEDVDGLVHQSRKVLTTVVGAEQQLTAGGEGDADVGLGSATVASVISGQLRVRSKC